jgi:2,5-diketo-D-gluconate reductase A
MPADLPLLDGRTLPALGFGLYKVPGPDAGSVVDAALAAGYRLADGAEFYGNEREVGDAIRRAVDAGFDRASLTVTSKFWGEESQSADAVRASFAASEAALGSPVDLYMIHWPRPERGQFVDVWRELIALQGEGRIRSIAVSNFTPEHLRRIIGETGVAPVVNQVEAHPWLPQHELRAFHAEHGIVTQAWSPLGRGRLLGDPVIGRIADAHGVSPARAIIRWHLQLGGALVPKSSQPGRLRENLDVDGFALSDEAMAAIATLATDARTGTHPDDRQ